jgi:hypothetical protein
MSGSNFLSRWSRLKRQSAGRRGEGPAAEAGLAAGIPNGARPPAPIDDSSAVAELAPEELARLPRIEDLTPDTDLAPFLRNGVPSGLRNAALRRIWALDPTIRDGVGDALDYAYDWNVAGGVPGSGPLLPSDDVEAMLRSIMGPPADSSAEALTEARAEDVPTATAQPVSGEPQLVSDLPPQHAAEPSVPSVAPEVDESPAQAGEVAGPAKSPAGEKQVALPLRRHGGATPF